MSTERSQGAEVVPRLVLFDVGNFIVRATHAITWAILEDWGLAPDIARRFFANEDYANFARGRITALEFYERIVNVHVPCGLPFDAIRMAHDAHIYCADEATLFALQPLRGHIPIAFATDTNTWQTARVRQLVDLAQYSNRIFASNELGALKGEPGTFERIVAELGERPEHVLLVDDSIEKIERARALGMPCVHYTQETRLTSELLALGVLREPDHEALARRARTLLE